MILRRWSPVVLVIAISLFSVTALLSQTVAAQSPDSPAGSTPGATVLTDTMDVPVIQIPSPQTGKPIGDDRAVTVVPTDLKVHEIDLSQLNIPVRPASEEKEKAALSSDYNVPTGGALGSGHAFMSISPDVVRPFTVRAVAAVASGFLPGEPVVYSLNGTSLGAFQASPTGVVALTFNTGATTGPTRVKAQGLYSGRVTGGVFQVQVNAPLVPGLAIAPHAVVPGGGQPLTLMAVGYPTSTVVTVGRNATAILTTTTDINGVFLASLAVGAGADASAVYNSYVAGLPGSMAGQSIEERADAGAFGDQNTARAMIDRAVLSSTVGTIYAMIGEDFQPGEFVTISPIGSSPAATTTADADGAVAIFIGTPGGSAQYHYRYNGLTSGRVAYGSAMGDPAAVNVPTAIVKPSHSGSVGTASVLYSRFITSQLGSLIVDGINVVAGGTGSVGIGALAFAKPITGPLVHSVAFSGTVTETQVAIAPLLLVGSGTLSGTVTDAINGQPIKATIQITADGIAQSVPPVGYVLPYQSGTYTATVVASGCYISQTAVVTITADTVTTRDFALARSTRDAGGYLCYENAGRAYTPAANLVQAVFDDESFTYTLPFSVSLYGVLTNTGSINGNGFATLGATIPNGFFSNNCIPNAALPNGILAAMWDDLESLGSGGIYTAVVGLAPHRTFVVEWRGFRHFGDFASVTNTVELQIDEDTGDIYTIYPTNNIGESDGHEATIGIENPAGTTAKQYQCNLGTAFAQETTNYVRAGNSVRFYLPQPLYDQYDNASSIGTNSQNFEPAFDTFDDFLADDFVVPPDQLWNVDLAEAQGMYFSGVGPARSVNVFFYSNAITTPGTLLAARTNITYTPGPNPGDFILPLSPPVLLGPGAYWMSVQANQDFTPAGQWAWSDRTVTTTQPAVWQNPAGGFGFCPTWNLRTICVGDPAAADQVFRLSGTRGALPIAQLNAATYSVAENAGSLAIMVTLDAPSPLTATVNFVTANGTATAGSDYVATSGTLTFTPGVISQTINVPIIDDGLFEENETFIVGLIGGTNVTIGLPNTGVVTIVDNDPPPPLVCGSGVPGPWVLRNFAPTPVYGAGVSSDGVYAYAIGGYSFQTGSDVTQTIRYNPVTNSWSPLTPLPAAVSMASAVYAPVNNKLYVFGGELAGTGQTFSTTRIYDVGGNSWSTGAPLPDIRAFMGSGYYNGKIYLVGGYSTGSVIPAYAQTWEYDVLANTWVTKTALPQALGGPASAIVNGHLYVIGGRNGSSNAITQTYDYDIAGDTWFTRTAIPTGVNVAGGAVLAGKVWVIGGGSPFLTRGAQSDPLSLNAPETFSTTQIYDPIGDSWSVGPSLNIQRSFLGATGFGNFAVAIGGYNGSTTTGATEVTLNCPTVQFSAPAYSVNENGGSATITVTLSAPSPLTATVNFVTANGTATAGSDYVATSGTLTFTPGVTSQTINVPIIDDGLFEDNETFSVGLFGGTNVTIGFPNTTMVTIVDNNDPPPPLVCGSGAPGPWVLRNFLPQPVYGASVTSAGPYAYAIGGYSFQSANDVTQTARYNPATNSWTPLAPLPNAIMMASAVYAPINNKLYVFGGELATTSQIFSTTRIYDIGSNSWSTGAPMPGIRAFMGSGYYNGKIYLVGGYSTGSVTPAYTQTWEYDVVANTWVTKTGMPQALGGPASAVVNGHLYIIGGRNISSDAITQTYDYDIAGDTWFTRTAIPTGVNVPGTAVLGGKVWVIGGGSPFLALDEPSSLANINAPETFSTTQIYDPIGDSWSPGPSLNIQRSFIGATGFGNFAVAIGGYNGSTTTGATEVTQNCPGVQFSAPAYSVKESIGTATITATLDSVSGVTATVNFATSDGTATAGSDYTAVSGTLTFAPGQTSRTFAVPIINDIFKEPNETVNLTLSNAISAILGLPNPATLTIVNDDYALYLPAAFKN